MESPAESTPVQGVSNYKTERQLEPLSRKARRAKTLLYVFLFAQAEYQRRRRALLAQLADDELPKAK
jgi:hypothetical protein